MKTITAILVFFLLINSGFGQSAEQSIISPAGGHVANEFGQVSWTLGDLAITTASHAGGIVTQGFQQSLLSIGHGVQIIKSLGAGWTWFSLNLEDTDMTVGTILSNLTLADGDYIKSQDLSATYYDSFGWFGDLGVFDVKETYKIKLESSGVLQYEGTPVNTAAKPITITSGWNWIGYLPQGSKDVAIALASLSPVDNDYLKSQDESTTYYNDFGWFGDLDDMIPLEGFMLKTSNPGTINYPAAPMIPLSKGQDSWNKAQKESVFSKDELKSFKPSDFEHSGQVTAEVILDGQLAGNDGDLLITISMGRLVGKSSPMVFPPTGQSVFNHLAYENSEVNSKLEFFFFDSFKDQWYNFEETLAFKSDMIEANAYNPFRLEKATAIENPLSPVTRHSSLKIYPNPVSSFVNINLDLDSSQKITLEILDIYGRIVRMEDTSLWLEGNHSQTLDLRTLADGVYFIRVKEAQSLFTRFTKVK